MLSALSFPFIYTRPNREVSLSLFSLISCSFLSQLIIKEKADPRWCWWLTCQSINQSINQQDQSSVKFKKQVESNMSSSSTLSLDHLPPSEQLCYVHCNICDTVLAVSYFISPLFFLALIFFTYTYFVFLKYSLGFLFLSSHFVFSFNS